MNLLDLINTSNVNDLASDHLLALWYNLNDDWDTAHSIIQVMTDDNAMWIHAYLHRKEPDQWNAKYWFSKCLCRFAV
jgi:hypothetical protein